MIMPDTSTPATHPESINTRLAAYISAHKEQIVEELM